MKWYIYKRGMIQLNRLATGMKSIHELTAKLSGVKFEHVLYFNKGPKLWFAWGEKEIKDFGKHILRVCRTNQGARAHFKEFSQYVKSALTAAGKIRRMDLKKCSVKKLIRLYSWLYKEVSFAHGLMDVDVDAVDVVFENFLQAKLKSELPASLGQEQFLKLYKEISRPVYQSYISQEEEMIIEVALKNKITVKDIKRIYNKFWWTSLGWENMAPHTEKYFFKAIKGYAKRKDLRKKLKAFEKEIPAVKKQRQRLIKKYKLSGEIKHWLKVMDKYFYYHDWRKEMQVKTVYANHLLIQETARRLKLKKEDLEWLWNSELQSLLRGKPLDKKEIARRKKAIFVLVSKPGIKTLSSREALRAGAKEFSQKPGKINILKGLGATGGKVRAKVKVCSGAQEALKKIKKGDILVCGMTLPDYLPAMKKAAAIITDEGGITCHAAIISRELGIPCIVGTKVATEILRDGDKVEVDADKGIVKIFR